MKLRTFAAVCMLAVPLTVFGDEARSNYEQLVDEMLEVTGALEIGEQMGTMVVGQMMQVMKAGGTGISDRALELMEAEVLETISEEMASGSFNQLMYPIYAKYLNEDDLQAILQFYSTPAGSKLAKSGPAMAAEGMAVGQQWGEMLGPKIVENVKQRLADEGIELQ